MQNIPFHFLAAETLESIQKRSPATRVKSAAQNGKSDKATSIRLDRQRASAHWREIIEHKWLLSERLGRDVGLTVAGLDYLENIARVPGPMVSEAATRLRSPLHATGRRLAHTLDRVISSDGLQALAFAQQSMHAMPQSLAASSRALPAAAKLGTRFPARLFRGHANSIEQHKWFLGERLGRDVGVRVASADYVQNVRPTVTCAKRGVWRRMLEKLMDCDGPNSVANLERAVRARTSAVR